MKFFKISIIFKFNIKNTRNKSIKIFIIKSYKLNIEKLYFYSKFSYK
jgi:hypothetical protein